MMEASTQIRLPSVRLADLPVTTRKQIIEIYGEERCSHKDWILLPELGSSIGYEYGNAVLKFAEIAEAYLEEQETSKLESLMKLLTEKYTLNRIDSLIERENVELRADYLTRNKLITSYDIHVLSGCKSTNTSEPASRWKREGRIFAVRGRKTFLYPSFQFLNGKPRPIIKAVLDIIAEDFSSWQIAFWFESGNGWLDGEEPQDCLNQKEDILQAAKYDVGITIG